MRVEEVEGWVGVEEVEGWVGVGVEEVEGLGGVEGCKNPVGLIAVSVCCGVRVGGLLVSMVVLVLNKLSSTERPDPEPSPEAAQE